MKCSKCDSASEDVPCSQYKTEGSTDFQVSGKNLSVPLSLWRNHSETTKHQMRRHDNDVWFSDLYIRKELNTCPSAGIFKSKFCFMARNRKRWENWKPTWFQEPMEQPAALVSAVKCGHQNQRTRQNWINGLCIFTDEFPSSVWAEEGRFLANHLQQKCTAFKNVAVPTLAYCMEMIITPHLLFSPHALMWVLMIRCFSNHSCQH